MYILVFHLPGVRQFVYQDCQYGRCNRNYPKIVHYKPKNSFSTLVSPFDRLRVNGIADFHLLLIVRPELVEGRMGENGISK